MPIKKKEVMWEELQKILQGGAWTPSPHTHEKSDISDWLHATSHEKGGDDLIDTLGDLTVDKLILGSYYLDSNALVANNLVHNSAKWNGQTIYLTDPTALQVLKYNSVTFRWENYDNIPATHASTHEPSGSDQIDLVFNSQKWNGQTILLTGLTNGQILRYNSGNLRWENYDVPPPPAHASTHEKGGSDLIDTLGDLTVDSLIIGSYYLDSDGLVANNKIFNSQKWDGQTILLTDPTNGQILRYNSGQLRWENYDLIPDAHASTHEPSGSDEIDLVLNSQKWNGQTIFLESLSNGQILRYDSGDLRWENVDFTDHNHTRSQVTDFWDTAFWANIPDKPSTFPPSSHKSSHEKGGGDLISTLGDLTVDKLIIGSYYLDSSGLVANNQVFNSQKWNGQTILLTGVTNGQILRYVSGDLRWENFDLVPDDHATEHHVGGGDLVYHDSLTDFVAAEHLSLPNTIANVLSDHNKSVHDSLGLDHGDLSGKGDDDHTQYILASGTRAFTGVVAGVTPTLAAHLATKSYVDGQVSGVNEFTELTDTPSNYTGSAGKFVKVNATPDALVFASIAWADVSKTGSNLTDLATRLHSSLQSIGVDDHHDQLHAATHEPSAGDQIDLVLNSQKWNGQTILLTDIANGQILRYDSGDLRWENADLTDHNHTRSQITDFFGSPFWASIPDKPSTFPPSAHASSHEKGGGDLIDTLGDLTIDQFIIGSYYLDSDGLVGNNKVLNSSKWDGQTIYLTSLSAGQILKYNDVTFRWENYDNLPDDHASTHLIGGGDPLSVGTPVNIGTSNAAGTATNFVRRDHVHAHPSGLGVDLHHAQSHTLASHSTKAHSELTGIGTGDHHDQLHATTHEPSGSDQIDLVFNSQKWNGQTILLTGITNGQILKYNSGNLRWENYDFVPDPHASTHEPSGSDEIDVVLNSQKWNGQTIYLASLSNGQILRYDSGDLRWENVDHNKASHDALALDHGSLGGKGDDDHSQYLLASGARALSAAWDAGGYQIRALKFYSDQATGTAPFTVLSTTKVANLNVCRVDNIHGTSFLRSDADDNLTAAIIVPDANRDEGIFGTYISTKTQHIWSMGTAYRNSPTGAGFGNLYGLAYKYNGVAGGHGVYLVNNGAEKSALGLNVWTSGRFISTIATGTSPLTVASTTKVTNLNADRLDNYHASSAAGNNTIVLRTASGYIYCNYLNCTSGATTNEPTHYFVESGNDSFLRQMTPANFVAKLAADGLMPKSGGTFTGAVVSADHGAAATAQVVSVCYGTGSPPSAAGTPIGTLFFKYTA